MLSDDFNNIRNINVTIIYLNINKYTQYTLDVFWNNYMNNS